MAAQSRLQSRPPQKAGPAPSSDEIRPFLAAPGLGTGPPPAEPCAAWQPDNR